ncbi:MAG: AMP-binding protein, partial [Polyangiaceae bacterium]|nr:AMP-binding protein [Polyangiaceae bacterium]
MSLDADDRHDSSPRLDKARLCSHHLFEHQARRTPDATAATFEGRSLTYRELEKRSNRLANHLRALGVGPDKLVGLCVERSLEMAIGLLGILKAGGAYVPIDPAYPQARIGQILRASKAEVLVTQRSLAEALPAHQAR